MVKDAPDSAMISPTSCRVALPAWISAAERGGTDERSSSSPASMNKGNMKRMMSGHGLDGFDLLLCLPMGFEVKFFSWLDEFRRCRIDRISSG